MRKEGEKRKKSKRRRGGERGGKEQREERRRGTREKRQEERVGKEEGKRKKGEERGRERERERGGGGGGSERGQEEEWIRCTASAHLEGQCLEPLRKLLHITTAHSHSVPVVRKHDISLDVQTCVCVLYVSVIHVLIAVTRAHRTGD